MKGSEFLADSFNFAVHFERHLKKVIHMSGNKSADHITHKNTVTGRYLDKSDSIDVGAFLYCVQLT